MAATNTPSGAELPSVKELREKNIPHQVFVHEGQVHSLEQAALERGQRPEQVVRSLLFRLEENEFALVLVAGPLQIPWKALRSHFRRRRLTLASEEEVLTNTGYQVGAVSPFGMKTNIPVLIDNTVFGQEEISLGSGRPGTAILLKSEDLAQALPGAQRISLYH